MADLNFLTRQRQLQPLGQASYRLINGQRLHAGKLRPANQAGNSRFALALANDCAFALTGGLYSRSPVNIERAKAEWVCGNLYINRGITGAIVGRQPFGGFKMSGGGTKAGGREYLQHFLVPRVITENCLRRGFAPAEE